MAMNKAPLGVAEVRKLKPGKRHAVGRRLYVDVGIGTWYARLGGRIGGTFREVAKVDWSGIEASLQNAHMVNAEMQAAYARGEDPKAVLSAKAARPNGATGRVTFGEAVTSYLNAHSDKWSNELHRSQWRDTLDTYGKPIVNRAVADVTPQDVEACMAAEWKRIPTTMQRTLARFRKVFAHSISKGWRTNGNPADLQAIQESLGQGIPVRAEEDEPHHPAMPWKQLPAFMRKLAAVQGDDAEAADCLRFIILTACRLQEGRDVPWGELDTEGKLWTVPGKRMKRRMVHRVPLCDQAVAILEDRPPGPRQDRVFANVKRWHPYELLEKLGVQKGEASVHGFRASMATWAEDNKICDEKVIDSALAHRKKSKTRRAYQRSDFLEERVDVMAKWGQFLAGK